MIEWTAPTRRPLFRQPAALAALVWLILVIGASLLAPAITPADPMEAQTDRALMPPGPGGPMGTDFLGRDMLTRLLWGGRWTFQMVALALAIGVGLGLLTGVTAGSVGGWIDALLMRIVDSLLAFPGLLMAMALVAIFGTGLSSVAVAVGLAAAFPYARVARSVTWEIRGKPYVEAARAIGCGPWRIAVRYILLNATPSLITFATTQMGWVLLNSAALNFLGLGVPLGTPEWGAMLAEGRGYLREAPWASFFPGMVLTLTVLATNLLGDGLQEALDR
jgi:ABC-type dipeptide/oligopeptide/nickel transport system permease subunit